MEIKQTLISGVAMLGLGLATAGYSRLNYDIGQLSNIGPGAFPFGIGLLLAGFGAVMCLEGIRQRRIGVEFQGRNIAFVLAAIVLFALLVAPFGLFAAVTLSGALAARAEPRNLPLTCLTVGMALAIFCSVLFVVILGLPLRAFAWRL